MYNFIYITAPSLEEAEKIAKRLLEKKLAACVNIFPIKSFFWWEGKIEAANEFALIVKTTTEKFAEVRDEVKAVHSYTTPCICTIPIERGLKEFLEWIEETVE
ncbi:MAG: divalent-cation tolerance protein CutA [Archaeoglobus sp.]|uniref:divalent-cation tolerance protein CutA n=1 Tax=Archaeoglobus sp. TaxID=1872626 RepID=UPI001DC4DD12|nr:divalent-cation tolerance protein CutA [Archaeoglobus sp.]MBO8179346.1 divalent-cation tolerance protein CutA [Archaeoglobus sp.]